MAFKKETDEGLLKRWLDDLENSIPLNPENKEEAQKDKDFDNVLTLSEAILFVRTKEEMEANSIRLPLDNHFYFKDLSHTKVFDYLLMVDEKNMERGLALVTETMGKIASMEDKESGNEVFDVGETFHQEDRTR